MQTINATDIYGLTGVYGPGPFRLGVLSEWEGIAEEAGMIVRTTATSRWVTGPKGGAAFPILCSELIPVETEDGIVSGRCGQAVTVDSAWCPGHCPDGWKESCEHGLSASLCNGPDHY